MFILAELKYVYENKHEVYVILTLPAPNWKLLLSFLFCTSD